jgi:hypothetical protein
LAEPRDKSLCHLCDCFLVIIVFWLLSSHLAIIVLTLNQVFVARSFSFTGSPIHPPPLGALKRPDDVRVGDVGQLGALL